MQTRCILAAFTRIFAGQRCAAHELQAPGRPHVTLGALPCSSVTVLGPVMAQALEMMSGPAARVRAVRAYALRSLHACNPQQVRHPPNPIINCSYPSCLTVNYVLAVHFVKHMHRPVHPRGRAARWSALPHVRPS